MKCGDTTKHQLRKLKIIPRETDEDVVIRLIEFAKNKGFKE